MASNITYEDALNTLKSMFGNPWTQDHLDTLLRHFQGHMENTVEAVLSHGSGNPEDLIAQLQSPSDQNNSNNTNNANSTGNSGDTSMDAEIARQLAAQMQREEQQQTDNRRGANNNTVRASQFPGRMAPLSASQYNTAVVKNPISDPNFTSTSTSTSSTNIGLKPNGKKWIGTPTELPPDFLRLPEMMTADLNNDEALARMLQDSLFTEELANNPEFAHLARGRRGSGKAHQPPSISNVLGTRSNSMEGPNIVDKLSEMGENAKKRLAIFASQFNAKKNTNNMNENSESRGLLDDSENGDDDRNVEMKSMGFNWRNDQDKKKD